MSEPAQSAAPHSREPGGKKVASPLETFPGMDRILRHAADAIIVTDMARRVVEWSPSAAELYGIERDEAVGREIGELFESRMIGQGTAVIGPRLLTLSEGNWRGRVVDRPTLGRNVGRDLLVETALSRLEDEGGTAVGVLAVKREVGSTVRLEQELSTLTSITAALQLARSRQAIAGAVVDRLMRATGATMGLVRTESVEGDQIETARGVPMYEWATRVPPGRSPVSQAVRGPGIVLSGNLSSAPLSDETRDLLAEHGIAKIVAVGLHRHQEQAGFMMLGYPSDDAEGPSTAMLLQAAAQLQLALDNARFVEELEAASAMQRRFIDQQLALQSLTELSERSDDFRLLAERTVEQVGAVLGGVTGSYTLLDRDGASVDWFDWNTPPAAQEQLRVLSSEPATPLRRFSKGESAYVLSFGPETVTRPEAWEFARSMGWTGYAALPIIITGTLEGIILIFFDEPLDKLAVDPLMLESIAQTASISLGNFRLRERLVASERRYRTMFESSPEPYLVVSLDGRIVDANAAAGVVFGGSPRDLIGLSVERVTRLVGGDAGQWAREALERGSATFRGTGARLDETSFPEEAVVSVVELEGERRALVLVRDLSEQERLQQELFQAQKMDAIGQLVSGVAHELNNPLAAILGFSQLIRRDERLPDEMRRDAGLLVEEASRTQRIVQNLLDFARQRAPERHPTSIRTLVEAVLVLQSYSLGKGRIEVDVDIPDDLPPVELDRSQIQQVIVNLTQNAIHAIQASEAGGRVRITARVVEADAGERVRVSIADDGIGVAPEHVDQLFVPFFTTKAPSEGTGLGLPVSQGIVSSHGGELRYEPPSEGRGAVFSFDLPVRGDRVEGASATGPPGGGSADRPASATERPTREPSASPTPATTDDARDADTARSTRGPDSPHPRVLVLDDERSIRLLLEKWLRASGYDPLVATTGEEAVALVRAGPVDAILCDHRMAGMNGTEVFEAVVAVRPEVERRFVFMSGDVLNPQLREFVEERGIGLLAKPFDLDTVQRTLRAILG